MKWFLVGIICLFLFTVGCDNLKTGLAGDLNVDPNSGPLGPPITFEVTEQGSTCTQNNLSIANAKIKINRNKDLTKKYASPVPFEIEINGKVYVRFTLDCTQETIDLSTLALFTQSSSALGAYTLVSGLSDREKSMYVDMVSLSGRLCVQEQETNVARVGACEGSGEVIVECPNEDSDIPCFREGRRYYLPKIVANSIVEMDPICGDNLCNGQETHQSCSKDCTQGITQSSLAPPRPKNVLEHSWSSGSENLKALFSNKEIALSEIDIRLSKDVSQADITLTSSKSNPLAYVSDDISVFQYVKMDLKNINQDDVRNVVYTVSVPESWVSAQQNKEDIHIFMAKNSAWKKLKTTLLSTGKNYRFKAQGSDLGSIMIGWQEKKQVLSFLQNNNQFEQEQQSPPADQQPNQQQLASEQHQRDLQEQQRQQELQRQAQQQESPQSQFEVLGEMSTESVQKFVQNIDVEQMMASPQDKSVLIILAYVFGVLVLIPIIFINMKMRKVKMDKTIESEEAIMIRRHTPPQFIFKMLEKEGYPKKEIKKEYGILELEMYIKSMRAKGFTDKSIRSGLKKKGWPVTNISVAFKELGKR